MKRKPILRRRLADTDIEAAVAYYHREAGVEIAVAFIDSVEQAVTQISRHPASGSPSYAQRLDIPGLRLLTTKKFPYLIFYIELDAHIEIWRVLHGSTDIPAWMHDEE